MMFMNFLGPFITFFTLDTTRYGLLRASFSVTGDGKTGGYAAGSLFHSWHALAGHLHPPVDSPQIDSPRKLLSLSCVLTHEVCTAFPLSAAWNA